MPIDGDVLKEKPIPFVGSSRNDLKKLHKSVRLAFGEELYDDQIDSSDPVMVVYDACILYPAPLRDLLMWLAHNRLVSPRWSEQILSEWVENLLINRPDLKRERLLRTCAEMNRAVPDALVTEYEHLIESLILPDPDDRHVLAAAIHSDATAIVTFNLRDFPPESLAPFGVEAIHPDEFVLQLLTQFPSDVCEATKRHRSSLKNPPKTVEEFLVILQQAGLVQSAAVLRQYAELL